MTYISAMHHLWAFDQSASKATVFAPGQLTAAAPNPSVKTTHKN
jgi:hypothetical protein